MVFALTFTVNQPVRLGLHIPAQVLVFATICLFLARFRVRTWWAWAVTGFALLATTVNWTVNYPPLATDLRYFWEAGCDIWDGANPYDRPFILNPPNALPLFALFGTMPYAVVVAGWTAFHLVGAVVLVWLVHEALSHCPDAAAWRLPTPMVAVMMAGLGLSVSLNQGVIIGQLALLASLAVGLAMWGKTADRPFAAGLGLAIASIKAPTMVPFLLLFLRRRDWRAWAWMTIIGLGMTFAFTSPLDLPTRLQDCLANIARQAESGLNKFWNPINVDLIGFDRALYYCGVTDHTLIRVLQLVAVGGLTGWVAWQVRGPRALPAAAAWSLTALLSMLFLYHRTYDFPVLMIPLMYVLGRARTEEGWCRRCYAACGATVLMLLYFRYETVNLFATAPPFSGWLGSVAGAVIIPHATWLLLAAMALLTLAERLRPAAEDGHAVAPAWHADKFRLPVGDRMLTDPVPR